MPDFAAAAFDKPKGIGGLFVSTTCRPFQLMDINKLLKMQLGLLTSIAYILVTLSILLVPAWLWLVRFTYLRHSQLPCQPWCDLITIPQSPEAAIAVFVAGFVLFILADQIMRSDLKSKYSKTRARVTASNLTYTPRPRKVYTSVATAAKPALANGTSSTTSTNASTSRAAAGSSTAASGATAAAALPNGVDKTDAVIQGAASQLAAQQQAAQQAAQRASLEWKAVQQAFYTLDHDLYGNDREEIDLSKDELCQRIKSLCSDLHVDFHGSHITPKAMLLTIEKARKSAGL